ncbi:MAG: L-2-amino-thiazoline-4-carboxylic acid hydrolase [Clostridia bacterium]|nr:L-2-amino-thiazoline-4-carboxylic acid hydrolase [Clostridia bacterium]
MKTAKQIMKSKQPVKDEMDRQFQNSDDLWQKAESRLSEILNRYPDLPKGVHMHTDNYIFPSAAIYLTLREVTSQEKAYAVIEQVGIRNSTAIGRKLARLMNLPGMKGLFIRIWDPMTRRMFGQNSGFQNVFYPKKKGEYRMDILACPYNRYFTELGCPELTRIFCANDNRIYGNLPGIEFRRSGTLGTGADHCDFCVRKR